MHEGAVSAELGLGGYPAIAESTMVARDLGIARYESQPLHLQHLHVSESVDEVRVARERGVDVSCEASPHHLLLTDEDVRSLDTSTKMSPPLAAEPHRQALVEALRDGTIDCVGTDHAPHARLEKEVPFEAAPNGDDRARDGIRRRSTAAWSSRRLARPRDPDHAHDRRPARAFGLAGAAHRARRARGPRALGSARALGRERGRPALALGATALFLGREVQGRCMLTLVGGHGRPPRAVVAA